MLIQGISYARICQELQATEWVHPNVANILEVRTRGRALSSQTSCSLVYVRDLSGSHYKFTKMGCTPTELDSWQEYTLLRIDKIIDREPIYLLKMTCPSTGFIHAHRVPPDITSAREAIGWVNWGIDPEEFAVQT